MDAGATDKIAEIVGNYPDCSFVFTSRTRLPIKLAALLAPSTTLSFLPFDDEVIVKLLEKQLLNPGDTDAVAESLKNKYASVPKTPLLVRLVASTYSSSGKVPESRAVLFEQYAQELLRADAVGFEHPEGLHYVAEYLALHTHVESDGDRGFSQDRAVELLVLIADKLDKGYGVKVPAIVLLRWLERIGFLRNSSDS